MTMFKNPTVTAGRVPVNNGTPEVAERINAAGAELSTEWIEAADRESAKSVQSFAASDTLPADADKFQRRVLKRAGVTFGNPVAEDPIFTFVRLPDGWSKVASTEPSWFDLVDDKGRSRALICYNAWFQAREAQIILLKRFILARDYAIEDEKGVIQYDVLDQGVVVFTTEQYGANTNRDSKEWYREERKAHKVAKAWLNKNYPGWDDYVFDWR